jgi:hypothetical protein
MAISKIQPVSFSTEGIATVKITSAQTKTTLPTSLAAGTYRMDTGFSGTIGVRLTNGSTIVGSVTFATSCSITITGTATAIEIYAPLGAINGLVTLQFLARGVESSAQGWSSITLLTDQHRQASVHATTNGVYVVGGHNNPDNGWNTSGGTGTIEKWDRTSGATTTVLTNSSINYGTYGVVVGTDIYFRTRQNGDVPWYKFATSTNTLTTLAIPTYRNPISSAVVSNDGTKIYVFGAYASSQVQAVQMYTISTNTWSVLQTGSMPWGGGGYGGSAWTDPANNDAIYVANHESQSNVYRYNITANTWTSMPASCTPTLYTGGMGLKSPSGNWIYKNRTGAGSTNLSIEWFDVLSLDGTTSYRDLSLAGAQLWSALPIMNNTLPTTLETLGLVAISVPTLPAA